MRQKAFLKIDTLVILLKKCAKGQKWTDKWTSGQTEICPRKDILLITIKTE